MRSKLLRLVPAFCLAVAVVSMLSPDLSAQVTTLFPTNADEALSTMGADISNIWDQNLNLAGSILVAAAGLTIGVSVFWMGVRFFKRGIKTR